MIDGNFKCPKPNSRYAVDRVKKPAKYSPDYFGITGLKGDGLGVSICVIDTGYPKHKDIPCLMDQVIDFTGSSNGALDVHGHATGIAGVLKGHGDIEGMTRSASIHYAKAINDQGQGNHGAVQASILYAIVQQVDIIVMAFGSDTRHPLLQDAIKKAYNSGICMFAASGNVSSKSRDMLFPAKFEHVISVGYSGSKTIEKIKEDAPGISFPFKSLDTTFKGDKYIKMSGTSIATPVAAGMAALIIQNSKKRPEPKEVYRKIMAYCKS